MPSRPVGLTWDSLYERIGHPTPANATDAAVWSRRPSRDPPITIIRNVSELRVWGVTERRIEGSYLTTSSSQYELSRRDPGPHDNDATDRGATRPRTGGAGASPSLGNARMGYGDAPAMKVAGM